MSKHTRGSWWLAPALSEGADHVRIVSGVELVAKVGSIDHPWYQTLADARLIAAAPELLELLQEVVEDGLKTNMESWRRRADEAIAKATGNGEQ